MPRLFSAMAFLASSLTTWSKSLMARSWSPLAVDAVVERRRVLASSSSLAESAMTRS
jgi:hypothetical protein